MTTGIRKNVCLLGHLLKLNTVYHQKFSQGYENGLVRLQTDLKSKKLGGSAENTVRVKQVISLLADPNTKDLLHLQYAEALAKSCIVDEIESYTNFEGTAKITKKIELMRELSFQQMHLAKRGAGEMVINVIGSLEGLVCARAHATLKVGIAILSGGNNHVQKVMLHYLHERKDFRFTQSLNLMIEKCRSFDLEILGRNNTDDDWALIALEDLEKKPQSAVKSLSAFAKDLFHFLQLLCEGHNEKFQNFLRDQPQNSKSYNLVTASVDFLMFLQEGFSNMHWSFVYSGSKTKGFERSSIKLVAITNQVFRTLTEYIQGPCVNNQKALSKSRLWDCLNAFFPIF